MLYRQDLRLALDLALEIDSHYRSPASSLPGFYESARV